MYLLFLLALIENEEYSLFFHNLYTKYRQKMFYAAWRVLKNPQTSEDVMQDTFYIIASNDTVLKRLMELNEQSEIYVANYITKMCRNHALQKKGTAGIQREYVAEINEELISESFGSAESISFNPEEILCRHTDKEALAVAIKKLPPADEMLIQLIYFQNFTMDEVAQQLEISKNALYVRHHRALKALSKLLEQESIL